MQSKEIILNKLIVYAGIELLLFFWLYSLGREAFSTFVSAPDTSDYEVIALQLVETFSLRPNPRTLGYPLFLSLGYLVGGRSYMMYLIVGCQLILNIVLAWGCWRLLQRVAPTTGIRLRSIVTLFFFWAGMGMAFYLLSDFLAAFFFGIFLYGMLFWRSPSSLLLSGTSLALATLIRPTFTFVPFIIPIAAYFVRTITSKIPWYYIVAFVMFSLTATGISIVYQYTMYGYIGPSPVLTANIENTIYYALKEGQMSKTDYRKEFKEEVSRRAGEPYNALSISIQEKYAKRILVNEAISHPRETVIFFVKNSLKYILVPIESLVQRLVLLYTSDKIYFTYVRPVLGLMCLVVWLCSLTPPISLENRQLLYYFFTMIFLLYTVGISVITQFQGERIRFPVLAFMLPVMVWNVHHVHSYLHRWIEYRHSNHTTFSDCKPG